MRVLEDPSHRLYRAALKAIADCEILEGLAKLVQAAEQSGSAHGAFAGKQLVQLAMHLGNDARRGGVGTNIRFSLLKLLSQSISQFSIHRSTKIAKAFLVCVDSDNAELANILNQGENSTLKILSREWKSTQSIEVLELLVNVIGKHFVPTSVCKILFKDRTDIKMAMALARVTRAGFNTLALKRIRQHGVPECCMKLKPNDSTIPESDRWALWALIAAGNAPMQRIFEGLRYFLDNHSADSQLAIASILRHYPPFKCARLLEAIAPQVLLSKSDDKATSADESPDGGFQVREDVRKLLAVLPTCEANLRNAAKEFFFDFNPETFALYLDVLTEDSIECSAEIIRSVYPNWSEKLLPMLESPMGRRRCKAALAASYLGPHPDLKACLNRLLQDEFEMVREEAAYALKKYNVPTVPVGVMDALPSNQATELLS